MIYFACDYAEGAHEAILQKFMETTRESTPAYGDDRFSVSAKEKIRLACGDPAADVFLLTGGTQTNALVIAAKLAPWEGVISAETGHINCHESGAIEYTGHKVFALPQKDGKLCAADVDRLVSAWENDGTKEHMVKPGMVYISHPTEYGTLYTKAELTALSEVCHAHGIPLFLDGARLGYGLMSYASDMDLTDIARLCDAFYIGGTKVGALCGEAVVFPRHGAPDHFFTTIKQHGALLAKGRLVGIQFDVLFTDGLYWKIARHAIDMAEKMKKMVVGLGYRLALDSPTNQQFVILENGEMKVLAEKVAFSVWEPYDETHTVVRFCTSWATTEEDLAALGAVLNRGL
ncbi:MAG: aminotransferase class I/II-fold pyridoxal phosphate-dependent enzyme [Clostridia bacterium]|nr:aminotransferase class I/II-fold pyridoxal phosphate-dependent enzyme [Clostridia bacterium]